MTETECLRAMVAPGQVRPSKPYRGGVIQVHVTRACDKACFNCTQGSNLGGKTHFMPPDLFEQALKSLDGYWGVVGLFGGNPSTSSYFADYCQLLQKYIPFEQRGIWSNNPITLEKAQLMRATFNPAVSNLNVHLDQKAYDLFKQGWPECNPVGLTTDSRHSPPFVAMKDVVEKICPDCLGHGKYKILRRVECEHQEDVSEEYDPCSTCKGKGKILDESQIYDLISTCDINQHWSASLGMFRGQLRAWFCEIAMAQSILHQDEPDYPDTGMPVEPKDGSSAFRTKHWWEWGMDMFVDQVRKHCFDCGVPLRGYGELSQRDDGHGQEQCSETHAGIYKPKRVGRKIEMVTEMIQLGRRLEKVTAYLQNGRV